MNILLTGGGTGGHVIPNIALIPRLIEHANISYMGGHNSIEERLISDLNIPFYPVTTVKFVRGAIFKNLLIPWRLMRGVQEAKKVLRARHIDLVFAKGGYVSLPAAYAAKSLHIPVICHESDSTLGVANRLISKFSTLTITSYEDTITPAKKTRYIGSPIRDEIFEGDRERALRSVRRYNGRPILLIMGGSQGAKHINDFVHTNIDALTRDYYVIHITGKDKNNITHVSYYGMEYTANIADYMAAADIVISRSGANAVAELLALHKRCIFVPLETRASRGDQLENAMRLESNNTAVVLRECDLDMPHLRDAIARTDALDMDNIRYDRTTNDRIVECILSTAKNSIKKIGGLPPILT